MRSVEFGEAVAAGTQSTLFSDDKPDRFFRVIKFCMDETSGSALALKTGVPSYQVEDEEGRIHLLLHLPIEEENEDDGASGGRIRQALILVSGPINNICFRPAAAGSVSCFSRRERRANRRAYEFLRIGPARASAVVSSDSPDESIDA
jgi:hypothetical protein